MDKSIRSDLILNQNENSTPNIFLNNSLNENISWGEEYAKLYEAPAEVIAVLSLFYGGISIIAIIGNALVIWIVATTRKMHTVTNLYIANLAFADVIIGMFCIPFQFQAALLQRWNLPEFMCAFCPFVQVLSVNVSVFTLTAIAVDRHRAIINPLRARPTRFFSKVIIVTIWIAATAFSIPCAIAFRVMQITEIHREDGIITNVTRPFCENVNLSEEQLKTYRYYLVFVQYVVPFCVISSIYMQMAIKLWGSRTPGNAQDLRDMTLLRNKKKVIKMLIIVVVVFGVCWLPLQTYNILYVTWPQINEYRFINIIWFCCDWLAMSNSCYNPFIYGIYNEKFKREFNKRFSLCFCKFDAQDLPDRTLSVYTRASSIRSNYTFSNCNNNSTRLIHHRNNVQQNQQQRQNQQQQQNQQQKRISLLKLSDTYGNNGLNGTVNNKRSFMNNNCNNKSMLLSQMNENNKFKRKKNQNPQFQKQQQQCFADAFNTDKNDICNVYLEKDNEFWEHELSAYDSHKTLCMPKTTSNTLETSNYRINSSIPSSSSSSSLSSHNTKLLSAFELNENKLSDKKLNPINYPNNNISSNNNNTKNDNSNASSMKTTSNNIEMTEYNLLGRENNNKSNRGIRFSVKFNNF